MNSFVGLFIMVSCENWDLWCHIWDCEIILIMVVLETLELYTLTTWQSTFLDFSIHKEWENIAWSVYQVIIPEVYWIPSEKDMLLRVEWYSATSVFKQTKIREVSTDCYGISYRTLLVYIWQQNISSHANVSQIGTCKVWGSQRHCWGFRSLEVWHCIVGSLVPKVMEEHTAFILRTKQSKKNMDCWTLNIKALWCLETLGTTDLTMQCHIPEDLNSKILTCIY